ncbi:MAG TPA: phosphoenolpyruvate carboxylase, partial [Solirubrobacteraceae bacterium]|nr:phosphoenolpyruvate carboxylase [Solirubrobacteraceae bacterium]
MTQLQTPPRDFAADEALLTDVLRVVVTIGGGASALDLLDRTVALGRQARLGDERAADQLAELVRGLELEEMEMLVRSLTRWFQLVNLAEDNERIRRLRARDAADPGTPRAGSLRQVIGDLHAAGTSAAELQQVLGQSELRLVMTAHPTEARRRTTIDKLTRVFGVLRELDERPHVPMREARRRLLATVQELWSSDDLRAAELTVADEVRGGLIHFASTLAETIPRIYRDLEDAIDEFYPAFNGRAPARVPPMLDFGSWIGGDRDGNPF